MTVMELIERLECCETDAKVYVLLHIGENITLVDVTKAEEVSEGHENQVILR